MLLMKILSLAFALTLVVSPLAYAGGSATYNYSSISNSLSNLGKDPDANIASVKSAMAYTGTLPKDGPVTLTRTVKDTESGSTQSTDVTSVVTTILVMKDGKIASIDARATRTSVTTYSGFYASFMEKLGVKLANPSTSGDVGTFIIQKSFDPSTPTPTPHVIVNNKKTPDIATSVTKSNGTGVTTSPQQEVTTVVSPSAP